MMPAIFGARSIWIEFPFRNRLQATVNGHANSHAPERNALKFVQYFASKNQRPERRRLMQVIEGFGRIFQKLLAPPHQPLPEVLLLHLIHERFRLSRPVVRR